MHIHDFPEVYHGQGITTPVFPAPARRVTNKVSDTTYRITDRLIVAYVVVRGLRAGWKGSKIRDWYFSDLRGEREKNTYAEHIHMPDICIC
ncbi:hypothetical protein AXQ84_24330 [Salmonella enterica subsp. enterica serovar Typhimurium]|nr:hypothetical protein [Salmonella enterica]ECI1557860.1 hypothetical protein [Salmonella enterica subsp. enterica serovar Typhimurium]EDH4011721.1 hypothetical protein [Salmonella enterica subsp. enterica serovar Kottbus]EBQ5331801.1 hypothetical protein [Salmonella enterica]ECX4728876.1 hypothetical protein [Salmonella enterica subsp. enterica serovar Typhimurium]